MNIKQNLTKIANDYAVFFYGTLPAIPAFTILGLDKTFVKEGPTKENIATVVASAAVYCAGIAVQHLPVKGLNYFSKRIVEQKK